MSVHDEPIYIVFTVDGGYAMPLATAICSIAINAAPEATIVFHVLYSAFSGSLQQKVTHSLQAVGRPRMSVIWQEADMSTLGQLPICNQHLNSLVYLRLLIPALLPKHIRKAIYLDADTIVLGDISELWAESVEGIALLAARDRIGSVGSPYGLRNYVELGITKNASYFNSGVLVFNNFLWRSDDITRQLFDYITEYPSYILMEDQDVLNAVLYNKWQEIDFSWNWQVVADPKRAKLQGCWGLDLSRKNIIHFTTSAKPWLPGSHYAEKALFYQYVDKTEWRGWRIPILLEGNYTARKAFSFIFRMLQLLCKNLRGRAATGANL